jgi:hypothetical protein
VPKSWTPFQWAPFDGVAALERKLAYLKDRFRRIRGAKMKWHEPREAEIECVLSRGDRRMGRVLHAAWRSGVRFDGWSEHFRHDLWTKAFESEGIPKESYLREYALDEILPWDVLDVSIKKRWLQIELIKAKKEMRTEDCKWGHCYACGVPGNGEDTVLAKGMPGASPAGAAPERANDPAAYRDAAKGAAYRQKAMPDLAPATRVRGRQPERVFRHRVSFSKTGDARFLSHRNTMDVFERAIRAAGLPARYSEGFNPHMRLSMGPALALGLESRHEVFDVDANAPFPDDAAASIGAKLPPGLAVLDVRELAGRRGAAVEGREGRALLRTARLGGAPRTRERGARRRVAPEHARAAGARAPGGRRRRQPHLRGQPRPGGRRDRDGEEGARSGPLDSAGGAGLHVRRPRGDGPRGMSWRVTVSARFEAAHNLIEYEGGPEPLHGHSYLVEAVLESDELQRYDRRRRLRPREEGAPGDREGVRLRLRQRAPRLRRTQHVGGEPRALFRRAARILGRARMGAGGGGRRLGGAGESGGVPACQRECQVVAGRQVSHQHRRISEMAVFITTTFALQ